MPTSRSIAAYRTLTIATAILSLGAMPACAMDDASGAPLEPSGAPPTTVLTADGPSTTDAEATATAVAAASPAFDAAPATLLETAGRSDEPATASADSTRRQFQMQLAAAMAERDESRAEADRTRSQRNFLAFVLVGGLVGVYAVRWLSSSGAMAPSRAASSVVPAAREHGRAVGEPSGGFALAHAKGRVASDRHAAAKPRVTFAASANGDSRSN